MNNDAPAANRMDRREFALIVMFSGVALLIHLLTPLFARFRQQCPDVRLDVVVGNEALNLSKRDADVAIRATDRPPETLVGRRVARIAFRSPRPPSGSGRIS